MSLPILPHLVRRAMKITKTNKEKNTKKNQGCILK